MNISQEVYTEGFIYDRYLGEALELPYSFEQIKIQANETVSSELLNLKFNHLYDNFVYLYKNSLIASNVIPISSTAIAGITAASTNFTWYRGLSSRQFIPISSNSNLVGVDKTTATFLIKNRDFDRYSLLTSSGPTINVFNFDSNATYITKVYTQTQIDQNYGVPFKNICSFDLHNNNLFVLDCELNRLVKYDASGLTELNTVTNNRLAYVDSIGNYGDFNAKTDFNDPAGLTIAGDFIFVLDSGNSSIKKYDTNLNWIFTYRLYKDFLSAYPVDISSDSDGNLYVLTESDKLFIYNNDITTKRVIDLGVLKEGSEVFKRIVFSQTNNNIFYLYSNKNVYKKLVNKPYNTVGKYLLYLFKYDIPDEEIKSFSTAPTQDLKSDRNIMFSVSGNVGKFGNFYDNLNLFDVLAVRDFDVYSFDEINFNSNEYLQNWTINKNISKLVINHMRLRDEIIGKFIASKDYMGNIFFRGTRYLLPNELASIYFAQDLSFYIGGNEIITNSIVNRPLEKLYNIQKQMLNVLGAEIIRTPSNTNPIYLN